MCFSVNHKHLYYKICHIDSFAPILPLRFFALCNNIVKSQLLKKEILRRYLNHPLLDILKIAMLRKTPSPPTHEDLYSRLNGNGNNNSVSSWFCTYMVLFL